MKTLNPIQSLAVALALPVLAFAQDSNEPGKQSDALKNPAPAAPGRAAEPLRTPSSDEREPGKTSDSVKEADPASAQRQFSGEITSVSKDAKTITINDASKGSHTLRINDDTKLKRGDQEASWDDLKAGVKVEGTCRGGTQEARAETLNIQG